MKIDDNKQFLENRREKAILRIYCDPREIPKCVNKIRRISGKKLRSAKCVTSLREFRVSYEISLILLEAEDKLSQ